MSRQAEEALGSLLDRRGGDRATPIGDVALRGRWADQSRVLRVAVRAMPLVIPPLILLTLGYRRRWLSDDGYIDLRVVRNLLDGHGPVFNLGERVEAYTNPLWVALLALWGWIGLPLETGAWGLGLCFAVAGLVMAQLASLRLADATTPPPSRGLAVPFAGLIVVAIPVVWDFSTSGLETGLAFAWLGGSYWLLVRRYSPGGDPGRSRDWAASGALFGLGPLIRPDLALFSAAFITGSLVLIYAYTRTASAGNGRRRLAMSTLAASAATPLGYQVFRMGYFASLVPNTALAKEASQSNWPQGWIYASDFVGTYALWLPLLLLLLGWGARLSRVVPRRDWPLLTLWSAPVLASVLHVLYVVRVGGDFMHGRMLLPSLFGLALPLAAIRVHRLEGKAWRTRLALLGATSLLGWAIVCGFSLRVPYAGRIGPDGIADERGFYAREAAHPNPVTIRDYAAMMFVRDAVGIRRVIDEVEQGQWQGQGQGQTGSRGIVIVDEPVPVKLPLRSTLPPPVRLVVPRNSIGLVSYVGGTPLHLVDRLGLSDPLAARLELPDRVRGRTGHEKLLPTAWVVARFAEPASIPPDLAEVRAAHAALGCGQIKELLDAVEQPLTVRRFGANLRLTWRLHGLRVPTDPARAEARFCAAS